MCLLRMDVHKTECDQSQTYMYQDVGAGTRLSQHHDMQLHKKLCSCTDFTICRVLNWLITMQLHTHVIEKRATMYPTVQLHTLTFRWEKVIQNVITTAYHQWYRDVVTTSYQLQHPMYCLDLMLVNRWSFSNFSLYISVLSYFPVPCPE